MQRQNRVGRMTQSSTDLASFDAAFKTATDLHRAGCMVEADAAYERLLRRNPHHGPTLHMSGMLAFQSGHGDRAAQRLAQALSGGYRTGALLEHYGLIRQHAGDLPTAAASLRESLVLDPDSGSAWFNLGVVERQAGHVQEAIAAFARAAPRLRTAAAEHALGQVLQEAGDKAQAAAAYAQAMALDPNDAKSALNAGVIAQQNGDLGVAKALYAGALAIDPAFIDARINLACAQQEDGDIETALAEYQAILHQAPRNTQALSNFGVMLRDLGRDEEAEQLFRQALHVDAFHRGAGDNLTKLLLDAGRGEHAVAVHRTICDAHPEKSAAWLALARVLVQRGAHDQAENAIGQALALEPLLAEAHCTAGDIAHHRRNWPAAASSYRQAAEVAPTAPEPLLGLALVALKSGDAPACLAACDALLQMNRFDQCAIAYRALALHQVGQAQAATWLDDPDALVTVLDLDIDAAKLAELAADLKGLRSRVFAPRGQSIRGGTQTVNELFAEPLPSIRRFRAVLDAAITHYLAGRREDDAHPFFAARPARLHYHSWSVVLSAAGHHVSHIHPDGCISGVFYVAVPTVARPDDAGCIEFGRPGVAVRLPATPKHRLVRPIPGRLVLFPSYMWHGTRPFDGPGERITIAFDVRQAR